MKLLSFFKHRPLLTLVFTLLTFSLLANTTTGAAIPSDSTALNATIISWDTTKAGGQSYGCFQAGSVGNRNFINQQVLGICLDYFSGWYQNGGRGRGYCRNTGLPTSPRSFYFAIYNLDVSNDREVDFYGCDKFMRQISDYCNRGGRFEFFDWVFELDPEATEECVDA